MVFVVVSVSGEAMSMMRERALTAGCWGCEGFPLASMRPAQTACKHWCQWGKVQQIHILFGSSSSTSQSSFSLHLPHRRFGSSMSFSYSASFSLFVIIFQLRYYVLVLLAFAVALIIFFRTVTLFFTLPFCAALIVGKEKQKRWIAVMKRRIWQYFLKQVKRKMKRR